MRRLLKIIPLVSWRFVLVAGMWAVCVTLLIDASGAPFWAFYVAPLSALPLMFHELRAIDARYQKNEAKKKPLANRVDQGRKPA
jgi:hypothetical protein